MAPMWDDFHTKYGEQINIGKVDCTAENAKELCEQFFVTGFPTLLLFKGNKTYEYQYQRNVEIMYEFAQGGYQSIPEADIKVIPPRLKGIDKYKAAVVVTFEQIGASIDRFFNKFHLTFVPSVVRYSLAGFFLLAPIIGICVFLVFGELEVESPPKSKLPKGAKIVKKPEDDKKAVKESSGEKKKAAEKAKGGDAKEKKE